MNKRTRNFVVHPVKRPQKILFSKIVAFVAKTNFPLSIHFSRIAVVIAVLGSALTDVLIHAQSNVIPDLVHLVQSSVLSATVHVGK